MEVKISIPVNTTETVVLPAAKVRAVFEGQKGSEFVEGVGNLEQLESGVRLKVGRGKYCFSYKV